MSGYDCLFFTMQPVVSGSQTDTASETDPILPHSTDVGSSEGPQSLCEIRPLGVDDECQSIDADERCSLVNAEQPQCRICFDSEGYFQSQFPAGICFLVKHPDRQQISCR